MSRALIHLKDPIEIRSKATGVSVKLETVAFRSKMNFGDLTKMQWSQNQWLNTIRLAALLNENGLKQSEFERMSLSDANQIGTLMLKILKDFEK